MADDENSLVLRSDSTLLAAGDPAKALLSRMSGAVLMLASQKAMECARNLFSVAGIHFNEPDHCQIQAWAEAVGVTAEVLVKHLQDTVYDSVEVNEIRFQVDDGSIVSLAWDLKKLPLESFETLVEGLKIRALAIFYPDDSAGSEAGSRVLKLKLKDLSFLECRGIELAELDLINVRSLQVLRCGNNQLTELELSNVPGLQELKCWESQLTELDLTNVADLQELHCGNNQLTELDVSKLSNLHSLDARWNRLSQIDVAKLAASCEIKVDAHVKVIEQNGKRWGTE